MKIPHFADTRQQLFLLKVNHYYRIEITSAQFPEPRENGFPRRNYLETHYNCEQFRSGNPFPLYLGCISFRVRPRDMTSSTYLLGILGTLLSEFGPIFLPLLIDK